MTTKVQRGCSMTSKTKSRVNKALSSTDCCAVPARAHPLSIGDTYEY